MRKEVAKYSFKNRSSNDLKLSKKHAMYDSKRSILVNKDVQNKLWLTKLI